MLPMTQTRRETARRGILTGLAAPLPATSSIMCPLRTRFTPRRSFSVQRAMTPGFGRALAVSGGRAPMQQQLRSETYHE